MSLLHESNKGAVQPAHLCSLISTFVFHLVQSIISKLVSCKKNRSSYIVFSIAEQTGLGLTLLETPVTGFLVSQLI